MKINTVIFSSDESPGTDASISSRLVFDCSAGKEAPAAPGRPWDGPRNLAIALPVTRLFIYGSIHTDRRDRYQRGAVKKPLILVRPGFGRADRTAALFRFPSEKVNQGATVRVRPNLWKTSGAPDIYRPLELFSAFAVSLCCSRWGLGGIQRSHCAALRAGIPAPTGVPKQHSGWVRIRRPPPQVC